MEMLELSGDEESASDKPTIVISPSELGTMRQCPLKHQLTYGERWTRTIADQKHPLTFGTLWHTVLEGHYLAIKDLQTQAHRDTGKWWNINEAQAEELAATAAFEVIQSVEDEEARNLLAWMYDGNLRLWGIDPGWRILVVEHAAEIALPGPPGFDTRFEFRIKLKIDLVVEEQGRIVIVDHKSGKNLPNHLDLAFDDQFGMYIAACRAMGLKVFGAIHNAAKKTRLKGDLEGTRPTPLEERFLRSPLARGNIETTTVMLEAWQTAYERYSTLYDLRPMHEAGIKIDAPRSPDPSTCGWKCDWTEPCIQGRKGVDMRQMIYLKGYRIDRSRH